MSLIFDRLSQELGHIIIIILMDILNENDPMVTSKFINFGCLNAKYLSHAFLPRKRVQHFPQIFLPEALSGPWILKAVWKKMF